MRSLLVVVAVLGSLLAASPAQASPSWALKPTGVTAQLRGLSAVDDRVAWVSGSGGTVLRTEDGGRTWSSVAPPGTTALDFRDVEAFDARRAVVLSIGPGADSRIYRTADGGRTWSLAFQNTDPAAFYDCVAFFDRFRGLAVSDPVAGAFRVLTTADGGRTWRQVPAEDLPPALEGEFSFAASGQCVATAGPADAWIATGGGATARVLRSRDGGRHWSAESTPLFSSASAGVFAVAFRSPRRGIAIGGDYADPTGAVANLALTADGGRSWRAAKGPAGYRSGAAWLGSSVVAVGTAGTDLSRDGGRTWRSLSTDGFDTVDCPSVCWASGERGRVGVLTRD
ncbi:oxidoreductase [Actinosynnema sp. NPDC020468]|uniref:WD40/YVTN/BNR-like repeat-containing protein n=1 Tax=Actinosynnema sp. NPDC020468 TaxID=3154488 RepID=UPI0033F70AB2